MDPLIASTCDFLGKPEDSEACVKLFRSYGYPTAPYAEPDEPNPVKFWLPIRQLGLEIGFTDKKYHLADPVVEGGLLCTTVYFYNWPGSDIAVFKGDLPLGLNFEMSRHEVRQHLSKQLAPPATYERDVFLWLSRLLIVSYHPDQRSISDVIVRLPDHHYPVPNIRLPNLAVIQSLFGLSPRDPSFVSEFLALDIEDRLEDLRNERSISFVDKAGIEMVFSWARLLDIPRRSGGLVFSGFRMFAPREQESVGWSGELPKGLKFSSSPHEVLSAFERPPEEANEDDQSGYFLWKSSHSTVHIRFNKVENRILRVSVYAPGYWDNRRDSAKVEGRLKYA